MPTPKLSVLMTVHNGGRYLSETIDSILNQTFRDFEFIVADDGSTDDTWAILSRYAAGDARMTCLSNPVNIGITRTMNRLFAQARGIYVTRHDADDVSAPERFGLQVEFLDEHAEIGMVGSWVQIVNADGSAREGPSYFPPETENKTIQAQLLVANCLGQGAVIFRRQCLEAVGYYDENLEYTEDYDLWLRIAEIAQVAKLPQFLYKYRQHSESVSHRRYAIQMLHQAEALERAINRRYGRSPASAQFRQTALYYIGASQALLARGDLETAYHSLAKAVLLCPQLFEVEGIESPMQVTVEGQAIIRAVFDRLPRAAHNRRLQARLLSRLHMEKVFTGMTQQDLEQVYENLWPGLWYNPAWLMNYGVISIAGRAIRWRVVQAMKRTRLTLPHNQA